MEAGTKIVFWNARFVLAAKMLYVWEFAILLAGPRNVRSASAKASQTRMRHGVLEFVRDGAKASVHNTERTMQVSVKTNVHVVAWE